MKFYPGQYSFQEDINIGKNGEDAMIDYYVSQGCILLERCETIDFDAAFLFKGQRITAEIKTDVLQPDRGNIAIEFSCRGKASGINATKAEYYVTYFPFLGEIWSIKCDDLRNLIKKHKPKVVIGGDKGSNTYLYLFNRKKYRKYFKVTDVEKVQVPN